MLALSLAFAISIRIGGLIIVGYFGLWGLLWCLHTAKEQQKSLNANLKKGQKKHGFLESFGHTGILKAIFWALAVCVAGFFAGLLLWPYAMQAPIKNSIESYHAMSQFAIAIRQIYNGEMVWSDALPWYYTPKFIFTTIPIRFL